MYYLLLTPPSCGFNIECTFSYGTRFVFILLVSDKNRIS